MRHFLSAEILFILCAAYATGNQKFSLVFGFLQVHQNKRLQCLCMLRINKIFLPRVRRIQ
jgi:hypothetical protein